MRNLLRALTLALGLAQATQASAAVIPDLSGERGSSTFGLGAFAGNLDTTVFDFALLGPAQGKLVFTFATPGAFGLMIEDAFAAFSGPDGGIIAGPLTSGGTLTLAASLFQTAGSHLISITTLGDPSFSGQLKTYELSLAVTPVPAAALLLAPALAGLGFVGFKRRRAAT